MEDDERAAKEIQKKANEDASTKGKWWGQSEEEWKIDKGFATAGSRTVSIGPPSPTTTPVSKRPRLQA